MTTVESKPCNTCGDKINAAIHGAIGLAKSLLAVDLADAATIEARRVICRACPEAVPCAKIIGKFCQCKKCGCLLTAKTKLAAEFCPLGHWKAVAVAPKEAGADNAHHEAE
jgi:hypothetical protein